MLIVEVFWRTLHASDKVRDHLELVILAGGREKDGLRLGVDDGPFSTHRPPPPAERVQDLPRASASPRMVEDELHRPPLPVPVRPSR